MSRTSTTLLPSTQNQISATGTAVRADPWHGPATGLHTLAIHTSNFRGRVHIEASLAARPSDTDWFTVAVEGQPFLDFPRSPFEAGHSGVVGFNLRGNFVWLRARMTRDHLIPSGTTPVSIGEFGVIDRILLNN